MSDPDNDSEGLAARVSGDAYQVIGALVDAAGLWEHPEAIRALDYFGHEQWREGKEILPFGVGLPSPTPAAGGSGEAARRARDIHSDADGRRKRLRERLGDR